MRKILSGFLSLVLVIGCLSGIVLPTRASAIAPAEKAVSMRAGGACGDNLTWTLTTDGILTISGTGPMIDFTPTIDSKGESPWFEWRDYIKKIVIISGVSVIGKRAFSDLIYVSDVEIAESVKRIEDSAFWSCQSLTSVTIPDSVEYLGRYAFANCSALSQVYVGAKYIDDRAFEDVFNFSEVTLGDGVEYIGRRAFPPDIEFTYFNQVSDVNGTALYLGTRDNPYHALIRLYAYALREYTVNENTKVVAGGAFHETIIGRINLPEGLKHIANGTFNGLQDLVSVKIPESVVSIGQNAFNACDDLTEIYLPGNILSIGENAFSGSGVTNIHYGGTQETAAEIEIGEGNKELLDASWHYSCSGTDMALPCYIKGNTVASGTCGEDVTWTLDDRHTLIISGTGPMNDYYERTAPWYSWQYDIYWVEIQPGVTYLGGGAFSQIGLSGVTIPSSVTTIGSEAFSQCNNLSSVFIPEGVTAIQQWAFYGDALQVISIPNSVTNIGLSAFDGPNLTYNIYDNARYLGNSENPYILLDRAVSQQITSCIIHPDTKFINSNAFSECALTRIEIPDSVATIPMCGFFGCTSLTEVVIGNGVERIGMESFEGCKNLKKVTIGNNVKTIETSAFVGCSSLTDIVIPRSVNKIWYFAFSFCTNLTEIYFEGSAPEMFPDIFENVTATAYYPANDATWTDEVRQDYGGKITWKPYNTSSDDVVAQGTCGKNADWNLTAAGTLTVSGTGAMDNYGIATRQSTSIPWAAYRSFIKKIVISQGITAIGNNAFSGCANLKEVIIADTVTEIGEGSFISCHNLEEIRYQGTEEQWENVTMGSSWHETENPPEIIIGLLPGDLDGIEGVDNRDVAYLLWYTLFPEDYPLPQAADFDGNGSVDNKDVEYLLWHTLFPKDYPL